MGVTYMPASGMVLSLMARVMSSKHVLLHRQEVRIAVLMAAAERDEDGEPKGPAVNRYGVPALADVKVNSLRDRVEGKADATFILDGAAWHELPDGRQEALLHSLLCSLEPLGEADDCGRPKLRKRPPDFVFSGFVSAIECYGADAAEAVALRDALRTARPLVQGAFWGN